MGKKYGKKKARLWSLKCFYAGSSREFPICDFYRGNYDEDDSYDRLLRLAQNRVGVRYIFCWLINVKTKRPEEVVTIDGVQPYEEWRAGLKSTAKAQFERSSLRMSIKWKGDYNRWLISKGKPTTCVVYSIDVDTKNGNIGKDVALQSFVHWLNHSPLRFSVKSAFVYDDDYLSEYQGTNHKYVAFFDAATHRKTLKIINPKFRNEVELGNYNFADLQIQYPGMGYNTTKDEYTNPTKPFRNRANPSNGASAVCF